jgi:hypothetical protein
MDERTCACGFVPTDDYHLTDHLGEVFIPAEDRAPDGQLHAEAARDTAPAASDTVPAASDSLTCLCGYRAPDGTVLDAHLLAVFTPPSRVGLDGQPHAPTASPGRKAQA